MINKLIKKIKNKKIEVDLTFFPISLSCKKVQLKDISWYNQDYKKFIEKLGNDNSWPIQANYPCLEDKDVDNGSNENPYLPQDLYVARRVYENKPVKHVDVGSRVDGFVTHVAVFREIEVLDIRKMDSKISNVLYTQADLMDETKIPVDYCDSISCLHALEHFGLGRYGDTVDPTGHLKGFANITKILKKGGRFYFSVPMGIQRIEFNAHRIFGMPYLINMVTQYYNIERFAYIDDSVQLHEDVELTEENIRKSYGCNHGCAIFELKKK